MNYCCENCEWSEIVGSPILCNYIGNRTWWANCCNAWKPKEKETNMIEVVRCKDCKYAHKTYDGDCKYCDMFTDDDGNPIERYRSGEWFCADGELK